MAHGDGPGSQLREFQEGLIEKHREKLGALEKEPKDKSHLILKSNTRGIDFRYRHRLQKGRDVCVTIWTQESKTNKEIFETLRQQRNSIEEVLSGELEWKEQPDNQSCRIIYPIADSGIENRKERWNEFQAQLVDSMAELQTAFKDPLTNLQVE